MNLKTCYSGCMPTVARPSIAPSHKKIRVDKPELSIIIGMAGERQRITDQNQLQWATVRRGDSKSSVSLHLRKSNSNTLVSLHRGLSCHQLFVLLCHSQQAVPALPQQLHGQRRLPGTRHARFLHPSSRTSSERVQELPTLPIGGFVTEKVHVGIERNRAIPTKWRTGSSRRCVGGSRHMVDCEQSNSDESSERGRAEE